MSQSLPAEDFSAEVTNESAEEGPAGGGIVAQEGEECVPWVLRSPSMILQNDNHHAMGISGLHENNLDHHFAETTLLLPQPVPT